MTKIFLKTYGCALNQADSQLMKRILLDKDFSFTQSEDEAQVIIVNTCTVKGPTENKIYAYIKKLRQDYPYKKLIITGCLPKVTPDRLLEFEVSQLSPDNLDQIAEIVEEEINDNHLSLLTNNTLNRPKLSCQDRTSKLIEIVPISQGCLGNCSYCIVKFARGRLKSYPAQDILRQIELSLARGAKEVWLTSQDTGCYGQDTGTNLVKLLKKILEIESEKKFFIRLGMANPNQLKDYLNELIEIYKRPKMFKFLHLPLQSGSDNILQAMNRKYTIKEYQELVEKIRKEIPQITLSTDVIVGFPGETEEDFQKTLDVLKQVKPDVLNLSRFWPRPKTKAAQMKQLDQKIIKERSKKIKQQFQWLSFEQKKRFLKWQGQAIIEKYHQKTNTFTARNVYYHPIILNNNTIKPFEELGKIINLKIEKIIGQSFFGKNMDYKSIKRFK